MFYIKKLWLRTAALCICGTLLLTGCLGGGGSQLSSKNPTVVTFWHAYEGDMRIALDTRVEEFNLTLGMDNGVIIQAEAMGGQQDLDSALLNSAKGVINSAPMPDIFFTSVDTALELQEYKDLTDFGQHFKQEDLDAFVPAFLQAGIANTQQLVLPVLAHTDLVYLNNTAFAAFGEATGYQPGNLGTWEGVLAAARAYYEWTSMQGADDEDRPDDEDTTSAASTEAAADAEPDDNDNAEDDGDAEEPASDTNTGAAMFGMDSYTNYLLAACRQMGTELFVGESNGTGYVHLADNTLRPAFETYYTGYSMGWFGGEGRLRSDDVKTGALISYAGSSSGSTSFPGTVTLEDNSIHSIAFTALAYPVFKGAEQYALLQCDGICMVASGDAKQEGALLFLQWFTGDENNTAFALASGGLPVKLAGHAFGELELEHQILSGDGGNAAVMAGVYSVTDIQLMEGNAYTPAAFKGSSSARRILESTFSTACEDGYATTGAKRASGYTTRQLLDELDTDAAFARWMAALTTELDNAGIAYIRA